MKTSEHWRLFWAKTLPEEGEDRSEASNTHPLWAHLLDVANVAFLLWDSYLPESLRETFAEELGVDEQTARLVFSLWVGLHDTGKAIPGFQISHLPSRDLFERVLGTGRKPEQNRVHHGHATAPILFQWIDRHDPVSAGSAFWKRLAACLSFHHGRLCSFTLEGFGGELRDWKRNPRTLGPPAWRDPQLDLVSAVADAWLGDTGWPEATTSGSQWPPWTMAFAGWVTLSDWIGSMSTHFPQDVEPEDDLLEYIQRSRDGARTAIQEVGVADRAPLAHSSFGDLFPFPEPRPFQGIAGKLTVNAKPSLTIMEGPTGEGKTEKAFWLAARQQGPEVSRSRRRGVYIGMPTQATSNGLFPRFESFLKRGCTPDDDANLVLVHGTSDLHPDQQRLLGNEPSIDGVYDADDARQNGEDMGAAVRTRSWFLPKKRSLLAPYGVGTVDQTFLSILFSKHFFVRLLGLAGKTVIFDEVHAYDTYMTRLFMNLLRWLRALGTNVILLSATLPAESRRRMLEAWTEDGGDRSHDRQTWSIQKGRLTRVDDRKYPIDYPATWHAHDGRVVQHVLDQENVNQHHRSEVRRHDADSESILETVKRAVSRDEKGRGACVAVIVNTVKRAQAIYQTLREADDLNLDEDDLQLLHGRFVQGDRSEREEAALKRFGPERPPGVPGVLVATQVAEQSLDLDFDLMLTDLAPIDLLLQRAGRNHRHQEWHRGKRPSGYDVPLLYVMYPWSPPGALPTLVKEGLGFVYDKAILYRTWYLLENNLPWQTDDAKGWVLPRDYRELIEFVYGTERVPEDLTEEAQETWREEENELRKRRRSLSTEAKQRCIPSTGEVREIATMNHMSLSEDDSDAHRDLQALTRWSEVPSVEVICLHKEPGSDTLYLDVECTTPAPLNDLPAKDATRKLMSQNVRLSGRALSNYLSEREDEAWQSLTSDSPSLRYRERLVFEDGEWSCDAPDVPDLRFDSDLGISILHA
jgi:CRISPR-associated endonuclease/helicase Cas3